MKKLTLKTLKNQTDVRSRNRKFRKYTRMDWIAKSNHCHEVYKEICEKDNRKPWSRKKTRKMAKDFIQFMSFVENRMMIDHRPIPLNSSFWVMPAINVIDDTLLRRIGNFKLKNTGNVKIRIEYVQTAVINKVNQLTHHGLYGTFKHNFLKKYDIFEMDELFAYQPRKKPLKNEKRTGNI